MNLRRTLLVSATSVAVGLVAAAPMAQAATATPHAATSVASHTRLVFTGGVTMLKLTPATAAVLTKNSISVAPASEAKVSSSGIEFPIQGGLLNPNTLAGTITHDGGLTFTAGGKTLTIRDFTVNVGAHRLTAWVDQVGARIPVLDLGLTHAKITAKGTTLGVSGVTATLDATAAHALNGYFGTTLFSKGLSIGTVRISAQFRPVAV